MTMTLCLAVEHLARFALELSKEPETRWWRCYLVFQLQLQTFNFIYYNTGSKYQWKMSNDIITIIILLIIIVNLYNL